MPRDLFAEAGLDIPKRDLFKEAGIDMPQASQEPSKQFSPSDYVEPGQAALEGVQRAPGRVWDLAKSVIGGTLALPFNNPLDTAKNAAYGITEGSRDLLENTPSNIVEYLREHGKRNKQRIGEMRQENPNANIIDLTLPELPDWVQGWKPTDEQRAQNEEFVESFKPENTKGMANEFARGFGKFFPSAVATGYRAIPAAILNSVSENKNIFEDLIPALLTHKNSRKVGADIIKETGAGMGRDIVKAKEVAKKAVVEPYQNFKESGRLKKENLKDKESKLNAQDNAEIAEQALAETFSDYLHESKGEVKTNLANTTKDAYKGLRERGSNDYTEFENGRYGQKRIFEPIQSEFFEKQFSFPKGAVSAQTQALIDSTIGKYKEVETRDPLTGSPRFKIDHTKVKPTVKDYIKLGKQLRDEALQFKKNAESSDISLAEKQEFHSKAKALNRLRDVLQQKVEGSIPESAANRYKDLNKFWEEFVVPFTDKSFLQNAIKEGAIRNKNFLDKFDTEGLQPLKKALLENPEFSEVVGKHDWHSVDFKNPQKLTTALEGELGKTLPPKVKSYIVEHFSELSSQKATINLLTKKMQKDGLSKAQIDDKLSKYKKAAAIIGAKAAVSLAGTALAVKILAGF